MKLQKACESYGLMPRPPRPIRPALLDQLVVKGQPVEIEWSLSKWPLDPQFDELFALLERVGPLKRKFSRSGLFTTSYHGAQIDDYLIYVHGPRVPVESIRNSPGTRSSLYYDGQSVVAALRFNLKDPLGVLTTAVEQLLNAI